MTDRSVRITIPLIIAINEDKTWPDPQTYARDSATTWYTLLDFCTPSLRRRGIANKLIFSTPFQSTYATTRWMHKQTPVSQDTSATVDRNAASHTRMSRTTLPSQAVAASSSHTVSHLRTQVSHSRRNAVFLIHSAQIRQTIQDSSLPRRFFQTLAFEEAIAAFDSIFQN